MNYRCHEHEGYKWVSLKLPLAPETDYIDIQCDDIIDIEFVEPGNMRYVAKNACVLDIKSDSMYIDTIEGDICGWVNYTAIERINVVGHRTPYKSNKPETVDMVNHPQHYKSETGLETIDVIEAFTFDLKGIEATDTGNIIKYILRWPHKNGLEDLKKARWYLDHLINHVEKSEKENEK